MAGEIETRARGHLGADVVVKQTPGGREVAEFDIAVGVRKRVPATATDAEHWEDVRTDWVRVSVWGKSVDSIRTLAKGTLVEVFGRLNPSAYINKNTGEAGISLDVIADRVLVVPRAPRAAAA